MQVARHGNISFYNINECWEIIITINNNKETFKKKNQRKYPMFRSHPDFIIKDFIQVEIQGLIEHKKKK